jgi:hypothetical protein
VQVGGLSSAAQILQVTATSTLLTPPSSVSVTAGATAAGVDIYVPAAAAGLNLTAIGVGDPGTAISFGSSSIDVLRGTTKQLLLSGTGFNSGTQVTISGGGGGITLSGTAFQNGFIFVTIAVDASATAGARNIIVTNTNRDTSVMSGGMFIR